MVVGQSPVVLVVEDDPGARRLLRMGLELEGVTPVEAGTVAEGRHGLRADLHGVVLDRELPDGDGLDLLAEIGATCPDAAIVINSNLDDGREPAWVAKVAKGDLPSIVEALELPRDMPIDVDAEHLAVVDLVRAEAGELASEWAELCRWDPALPPDAEPPVARTVLEAVAEALERPQPLGWGPDPALQEVTETFAASVGAVDVAVGLLVCLRETLRRRLVGYVPPAEESESMARVDMIIDRAIWTAVRAAVALPVSGS